jgi:iron(II)-dependent oxidoreductase
MLDAGRLMQWVCDARERTLLAYADLDDAQLAVPYLRIINPPLWELGHIAWFWDHWFVQRGCGRPPMRPGGDGDYNSATVPHATRWTMRLPDRVGTLGYLNDQHARVLGDLARGEISADASYFATLATFHEDMHVEAFLYTRQTLALPPPPLDTRAAPPAGALAGDVAVDGGRFRIGAERDPAPAFVFDNEKWAHDVELAPFRIARAPVTQAEFAAFVDDGGYATRALWSDAGWSWRESVEAHAPLYWRRRADGWERRVFDRWVPIAAQPHRPAIHVGAHEAEAWCVWAQRRLPSEAEWEIAARGARIDSARANLDFAIGDTVDVAACADGDSASGCRQMFGNVWEWTATAFAAYPGFVRDPYAEYSEPWFGDHRVLRGGCFVTRARVLRPTWRNFYTPDRRDVWAGFRTCAR